MNVFEQIRDYILRFVLPHLGGYNGMSFQVERNISVELPRDPQHGDVATNAAMVLAKPLKRKPREIAEEIRPYLEKFRYMVEASIAGPGFINMRLTPEFWHQELRTILTEHLNYGASTAGLGQRVNIEYVSANPTGPMHVGHARGAVVGDALARLLQKASYEVVKEYYINDAGVQVDTLARSAYIRYQQEYGHEAEIPEGMYPGEYLVEVGRALKEAHGGTLLEDEDDAPESWLEEVRSFAIDAMMAMIRSDLEQLGVEHEIFVSERSLHEQGWLEKGVNTLEEQGLIYRGVLEPPKGKAPEDWEPEEQTLFRSTAYGDDSDRPVIKANGEYAYFAGDIGYTTHKLARGFDTLVMVLGADHAGYVKRMEALTEALSENQTTLNVQLCQLVRLMDGGEPLKMSKRSGSFVTVRDVVNDVGKDVLRFIMLTRKPEQPLDFDLQKVTEQSKDNPVFYVQYAHARCKSLLRLAAEQMPEALRESQGAERYDPALMNSPAEISLLKQLALFPKQVEAAARAYEPHRIAYYLQDVAGEFHAFWTLGGSEAHYRFIHEDNAALTTARLALARGVATVIAAGLHILGVEPVEELR